MVGIYVDPKARLVNSEVRITEVFGAKGESLKRTTPDANGTRHLGVRRATGCSVPVMLNDADGEQRIARLSGSVRGVLLHCEKWEIPNVLEAGTVTRATRLGRFTFVSARRQGANRYAVSAIIPKNRDFIDHLTEYEEFNPVDDGGRLLPFSEASWSDKLRATQIELVFVRPVDFGEPVKLAWEIPSRAQEVSIPVEFKDLPLP